MLLSLDQHENIIILGAMCLMIATPICVLCRQVVTIEQPMLVHKTPCGMITVHQHTMLTVEKCHVNKLGRYRVNEASQIVCIEESLRSAVNKIKTLCVIV